MISKLDRIGARRDKLYAKRDEILKAVEDVDKEYEAEENLEAGDVLRFYKLKPVELAEFLKNCRSGLPGNMKNEDAFMEKDDDGHIDDEEDKESYEKY